MSSDWNFDFPFSPFDAIPDRVDMLSAGNHLEETDPWNEPYCCKHNKPQCLDSVAVFPSAHILVLTLTDQTIVSMLR